MSLVCEIDPANAFVLQGTSRHCATCDSIWQKLSSHGLCPFQSLPGSFDTLFSNNIEEYCNKSFVPCLFTAGFSCIMVFFESDTIVAGCIRDIGSKFVKFQQSAHNPKVQEVVDIGHIYIGNPCSARSDNCAPSEVIHENRSMILPTCCCKGHRCTSPSRIDQQHIYCQGLTILWTLSALHTRCLLCHYLFCHHCQRLHDRVQLLLQQCYREKSVVLG
ncbi:hypothetical protein KIN20_010126 [Parelaphostrongylus tenuis]|uniref:Uncharacterized protein n=1 Tax=Parelaphostrongylus tenuis TaxID=148309 RepID=A0AAD5QK36_PARTN|nr:hypothetical protein KIN20_010126 [Parelaphostrongylus tenuis]